MSTPYSLFNTRSATDPGAPATVGVAISGTTTYYSDQFSGEGADGAGLTVFYTGTPTGTLTLWMTDKPLADVGANDNDWVQDTTFAPTNPAGAAAKFRDEMGNAKAYRKRLKYVNASGSGTVIAYATVNRFSAA